MAFGSQTYSFLYSSLSRSGVGQPSQETLETLSSPRPKMPYTKTTFLHSASSDSLPHTCCHSHVAELLLQQKLSVLKSVQGEQSSLDQPVPSMTCSQRKVSPIHPSSGSRHLMCLLLSCHRSSCVLDPGHKSLKEEKVSRVNSDPSDDRRGG